MGFLNRLSLIILLFFFTSCSPANKQNTSDVALDRSIKTCQDFYYSFPKKFDLIGAEKRAGQTVIDILGSDELTEIRNSSSGQDDILYDEVQKHPCYEYLIIQGTKNKPQYSKNRSLRELSNIIKYVQKNMKLQKEEAKDVTMFWLVTAWLEIIKEDKAKMEKK